MLFLEQSQKYAFVLFANLVQAVSALYQILSAAPKFTLKSGCECMRCKNLFKNPGSHDGSSSRFLPSMMISSIHSTWVAITGKPAPMASRRATGNPSHPDQYMAQAASPQSTWVCGCNFVRVQVYTCTGIFIRIVRSFGSISRSK